MDSDRGKPLRILIAGGAGFVGSHLCDRLSSEGHHILAVDNCSTGRAENIQHLRDNSMFEFLEHDICQTLPIDSPIDRVYNLASPASPFDYLDLPIETMMVGSAGTKNLLDLARDKGAAFLMASTSETYGDPLVHPQVETYWGHVNPIGPRSVYDEAKRFSEALTMAYHRTFGVETHIARIFNTFGPRMKLNDGRVVPTFLDQALQGKPLTVFGDGSQTRSFCFVSDLVEGLHRLMESDEREPVNLGNPTEMTILEFAQTIRSHMGSDSEIDFRPLPQDDPKQRRPDIGKAKRVLDWEPRVPFAEGLEQTIEFFRSHEPAARSGAAR